MTAPQETMILSADTVSSFAKTLHFDGRRAFAAAVGEDAARLGFGPKLDIARLKRGAHTADIGIAFGMHLAREAIAGLAADTTAAFAQVDRHRQAVGVQSLSAQLVDERGDSWLVRHLRKGVRAAAWRFTGIIAGFPVHEEKLLGQIVIGFQVFVTYGPGGRGTALVLERLEVFAAEAWQRGAVNFSIATDVVMHARLEAAAVPCVNPGLGGLVAILAKDSRDLPVLSFLRQEITPFNQQDARATLRKA